MSAALLAACGIVFVLLRVLRDLLGAPSSLWLPIVLAVVDLTVAAALLGGLRGARPAGVVVAAVGAVLQFLVLLGGGPMWTVVAAGVLAAAYIYAGVLLNTGPARGIERR